MHMNDDYTSGGGSKAHFKKYRFRPPSGPCIALDWMGIKYKKISKAPKLFAYWLIFHAFLLSKNLSGILVLLHSLDSDQAQHFVRPDLGPNCLQRFGLRSGLGSRLFYTLIMLLQEFFEKISRQQKNS